MSVIPGLESVSLSVLLMWNYSSEGLFCVNSVPALSVSPKKVSCHRYQLWKFEAQLFNGWLPIEPSI